MINQLLTHSVSKWVGKERERKRIEEKNKNHIFILSLYPYHNNSNMWKKQRFPPPEIADYLPRAAIEKGPATVICIWQRADGPQAGCMVRTARGWLTRSSRSHGVGVGSIRGFPWFVLRLGGGENGQALPAVEVVVWIWGWLLQRLSDAVWSLSVCIVSLKH